MLEWARLLTEVVGEEAAEELLYVKFGVSSDTTRAIMRRLHAGNN